MKFSEIKIGFIYHVFFAVQFFLLQHYYCIVQEPGRGDVATNTL